MKKLSLLFVISLITLSAFAKVRYQKVEIFTAAENEVYINGEIAYPEKGKYLLPRNQEAHTITVKREGYKDASICAVPYASNGYTYPSEYKVGLEMIKLPQKLDEAKNLRINTVSIDLANKNNKIRVFEDYDKYLRKSDKIEAEVRSEEEDIKYDNSIFSIELNSFLKEVGFIDTSDKVLKNGYLNNLITDVKITEYTYNRAPAHSYYDYGGMIYTVINAEWTLKDVYGEELYKFESTSTSDHLAYTERDDIQETTRAAITDALTKGLINFMNSTEVVKALKDKTLQIDESNFEPLTLSNSTGTVSSLSEAIESSVTVKSDNSHGSGFFVSSEGHIVTNYHVISQKEDIHVVLNDQTKLDAKVVRVSKIHDLALLKIEKQGTTPFKISNSEDIPLAADIFAVGTPTAEDLSQTVSKGIISGFRETDQGSELIQIDASINSGNSGGAIINKEGLVLGVVSSKIFGYGIEGIAFGIPSYEIYNRLKINY